MSNLTILCPNCHKNIKTRVHSTMDLPSLITCPGCATVAESSRFIKHEPPIPNTYSADAAPVTIPEASPKPIKSPRKPSSIDVMFDIGHTRTKSYAQVLWVASLIASIIADCLLVMYAVGKSPITGIVGIVGVHLILMPMIRIALECAVNVERIAKK